MERIKEELFSHCIHYVEGVISAAQQAIDDARESANDDTKSSAGDKFETGREMMQQEIDRNRKQLVEAIKMKQVLEQIGGFQAADYVQVGSLVICSFANFYISISKGQIMIDGKNYFAVSAVSPIGQKLMRAKVGEEFEFNSMHYKIEAIY